MAGIRNIFFLYVILKLLSPNKTLITNQNFSHEFEISLLNKFIIRTYALILKYVDSSRS